jgi:hypothetical protein
MNLDGTELVQVVGHKLGVEQGVATLFKASDQVDEGYFAGVSDSAEHALAKERASQCHAIQSSDELIIKPAFHAMCSADLKQIDIEFHNFFVDPCLFAVVDWLGTQAYNILKSGVGFDLKALLSNGFSEPPGNFKTVERHDPAFFRVNPIEGWVVLMFRHWK